jgi:hypothetical protein
MPANVSLTEKLGRASPRDHSSAISAASGARDPARGRYARIFHRSAHVSCDMNNNLWDDYVTHSMLDTSVNQQRELS